jgi:divalent metal cation (Fe/Co/Zn/Cd) transporter
MNDLKKNVRRSGLPKFDSTGWLSAGIFFSLAMFGINLWALISKWQDFFFPFQISKLLGMAVGLVLAIHCVDVLFHYKKNNRLK